MVAQEEQIERILDDFKVFVPFVPVVFPQKHMLWVLIEIVSMKRFQLVSTSYVLLYIEGYYLSVIFVCLFMCHSTTVEKTRIPDEGIFDDIYEK